MFIKLINFLLLILPLTIIAQHSDLAEYGLKGRVKQMTAFHYYNAKIIDGKWIPLNREKYNYKSTTYFNESGNIDSIVNSESDVENPFKVKHEFTYENNRKVGGRYYDFDGKLSQIYSIEWKNKRKYVLTSKDIYGAKVLVTTTWLNRDFREKKAENIFYENDKARYHGKYESFINGNQHLIKAKIYNLHENREHTNLYFHFGKDQFNNITHSIMINSTNGAEIDLMIRTIEYY